MAHPLWIVLPVPAETKVQVKDKDNPKTERKPLDDYVKDFVTRHGYKITISHSSSKKCNICHYDCHRGGKPPLPKPIDPSSTDSQTPLTRSIKIRCPFRLTARFEEDSWHLRHVRVGHNHGPTDDSDDNLLNQLPVAAPTIVCPPEIDSRVMRIQQLSPKSQNLVLKELDTILDQHGAKNSSKGLTTVDAACFVEKGLEANHRLLNESDESCTEGIQMLNNSVSLGDEIRSCQAAVDAENEETALEHTEPSSKGVASVDPISMNPTNAIAAVSPVEADPSTSACVNSSGMGDEAAEGQSAGDKNICPGEVTKRATPSTPSRVSTGRKLQKLDKSKVSAPQTELTAPRTTRSRTQKNPTKAQSSRRITRNKS